MSRSLGEDLEREILVRLPAKSLMRFKCVQRSWNSLFKTPAFVTKHMHRHASDERNLMILHENGSIPQITVLSSDNPTPIRLLKSPFPDSSSSVIFTYGHCNGVLFLQWCPIDSCCQFILWNPSTSEVHHVPLPPYPADDCDACSSFGFGADPNTNDFKVVNVRMNHSFSSAEIYDLNTKSWTLIHPPPLPSFAVLPSLRFSKYNPLVNGVYHWITGFNLGDGVSNILCFDFRNHRFHEIRAPISLRANGFACDDITEVNGSLAYVMESFCPIRMGIWVMDQCGWVQKYNIGPLEPMICIRGLWKDAAQVLGGDVGQQLMSYDHDGNFVLPFQFDIDNDDFLIREYVQSIAPLSM